jgi:phage terminase small subunit
MRYHNAREQIFVEEYLKDLNVSRAARAAGYSPKTANHNAYRWIQERREDSEKPHLWDAVQVAKEERAKRTLVEQDDVIRGLLTEAQRTGIGSSHAARVSAYVALGKHLGMFVEKTETDGQLRITIRRTSEADT